MLMAQAGDRDALSELLESVYPSLLRFAASLAGPTSAEDIAQDTAVLVYRKLVYLQEPKFFRAWAFRIASRLAFARIGKIADGSL